MRSIYLIRHGLPDFPNGKRCCLGRLDLPLSEKGKNMASALESKLVPLLGSHALSSPLKRCTETAEAAGFGHFDIIEDFAEVDTGDWDGFEFSFIKERWPQDYAARGVDEWNEPFPGGESLNDCFIRASRAMTSVLKKYPAGDLYIFAHRGVIQALYAMLTKKSREEVLRFIPDYCEPVVLLMEGDSVLAETILLSDSQQMQFPDRQECEKILTESGTPGNVIGHCRFVAEKAEKILQQENLRPYGLNEEAVIAAAMLHDIARTQKDHALAGAKALFELGCTAIAPLVGDHMELPAQEEYISEKSLVFLADKYIKDDREVTLEERYLKDRTGEMRSFAEKKMEQALRMQKLFFES